MKSVSIIICTFNEEQTISEVVTSCCKHNKEAEVIVVDDGSTDHTESILVELKKSYIFCYEKLPENKGKSWAMAHGVEISTNEIILFYDADLSNITREHFENILQPIFDNSADMVLGQPSETFIDYRVNPFKSLTGERALLKTDILPILDDIREIRFGVETFINLYYQAKGKRIKYVLMKGLIHPTKYSKTTSIKATKEYITEGQEIALTILENFDLITQRIEYLMAKSKGEARTKFSTLQKEINEKIMMLKDKMDM